MATEFKARDVQPTVLRLHPDLRDELIRLSVINDRSLSKEIAARLRDSLKTDTTPGIAPALNYLCAPQASTALATGDGVPNPHQVNDAGHGSLHVTDQAMLRIFRALPAEKQLALLSLFK